MDNEDAVVTGAIEAEMRFEPLEVTVDLFQDGLTLWDAPLHAYTSKFKDALRDIFTLQWDVWPPTVGVREISLSTDPAPGSSPPESVWARVSIFGLGFEPGVPVVTKWNNAFGFADNGAGANSILLQSPVPDANGRFAFQVIHKAVKRAAKDWLWGDNLQLVLDAQQRIGTTPNRREAYQRGIPGHVLWQWVP
jgi:hypothetical protein